MNVINILKVNRYILPVIYPDISLGIFPSNVSSAPQSALKQHIVNNVFVAYLLLLFVLSHHLFSYSQNHSILI